MLGGVLHPSTEVLYHEGDVGQDCLCLKVPRSQDHPITAIALGSMEITWRREYDATSSRFHTHVLHVKAAAS